MRYVGPLKLREPIFVIFIYSNIRSLDRMERGS